MKASAKLLAVLVSVAVVVLFGGCATVNDNVSGNYQRSALRGAGDLGATALMEEAAIPPDSVMAWSDAVLSFLIQGETGQLVTRAYVETGLRERIPARFSALTELALQAIPKDLEPSAVLPQYVIDNLIAVCRGAVVASLEYREVAQ